jgi:hypothetical protein
MLHHFLQCSLQFSRVCHWHIFHAALCNRISCVSCVLLAIEEMSLCGVLKRGVHSLVQVPIGTQYIMVPNSISTATPNGLMVEIYWQQDDEGALRISGQSEPIPATMPSFGANPL